MNIREIPFEPKAKAEHIALAEEFLDTIEDPLGVGNYRVVTEKGHTDFLRRPCHANLGASPNGTVRLCVALHTGSSKKTALYRKWLWEESFASRFVLSIRANGAVVSGDIPSILMQNIAIMSRHCREYASDTHTCFPMFDELYPKIGGELAYVLAFNTSFNAASLEHAWNAPVLNGAASHRAWPLFQLKSLRNFLTGNFEIPADKLKELWTTHAGLYGGASLCGAVNDYSSVQRSFVQDALDYDDIRQALSEYRKTTTTGEAYRPPNPFAPWPKTAILRSNDATFREVVEVIIPALKKKELIP